jgi:hypothetical protein
MALSDSPSLFGWWHRPFQNPLCIVILHAEETLIIRQFTLVGSPIMFDDPIPLVA